MGVVLFCASRNTCFAQVSNVDEERALELAQAIATDAYVTKLHVRAVKARNARRQVLAQFAQVAIRAPPRLYHFWLYQCIEEWLRYILLYCRLFPVLSSGPTTRALTAAV